MLEFLVLGQIPGTHMVLTLPWVVAIAVVTCGSLFVRHEHKRHGHITKQSTN